MLGGIVAAILHHYGLDRVGKKERKEKTNAGIDFNRMDYTYIPTKSAPKNLAVLIPRYHEYLCNTLFHQL